MSKETLRKLGEELKATRKQKDITLQQIFNKTRIDMRFLDAIESGDFEVMPDVYIRAFIREYAKSIELDGNTILRKYEIAKEGREIGEEDIQEIEREQAEKQEPAAKEFSAPSSANNESNGNNKNVLIGIYTVAGLAAIFIIYLVFFNAKDQEIITEKPYQEVLEETKTRFEVPAEKKKEEMKQPVVPIVPDSLNLVIIASDTCWIGGKIDSSSDIDFLLYPGRKKILKAKTQFYLVAGNAGGIEFLLNGKKLDYKGRTGRAILTINSEGIVR